MKRIQNLPAARPRKTLARSAVLLALALAAPASARTLAPGVLFEVTYAYDSLGRPASRTVNGELQVFEYDGRDRLVAVRAEDGSDIERYRYDAAGNILEKTVRGETTRFVYDAANQLVSRTDGSGTTAFAYDAAGRLVREGDRRFVYGNDGHVSRVLEGGAVVASFDYFLDGQVAAVHARGHTERFLWDGLAMAARGDRTFLNEPAATGGNPVASMGRSFLNDMLGSTVGVHDRKARTRTAVSMTLFGETDADEAYFTGKPALPELGYAFLVRSYRADLGKWQTRDPFGYPDGWNAMVYCGNITSHFVDILGGYQFRVVNPDIIPNVVQGHIETNEVNSKPDETGTHKIGLRYSETISSTSGNGPNFNTWVHRTQVKVSAKANEIIDGRLMGQSSATTITFSLDDGFQDIIGVSRSGSVSFNSPGRGSIDYSYTINWLSPLGFDDNGVGTLALELDLSNAKISEKTSSPYRALAINYYSKVRLLIEVKE